MADPSGEAAQQDGAGRPDEGQVCDFCGKQVPSVRRVAVDEGYDRLVKPHREQYACPECSRKKDAERSAPS